MRKKLIFIFTELYFMQNKIFQKKESNEIIRTIEFEHKRLKDELHVKKQTINQLESQISDIIQW